MILPKKRAPYGIQAPLTSLIDIIFMLLIYFMLTTNFITDEAIKIKLPRAGASKAQTEQALTIHVNKEGQAFIEGIPIAPDTLFSQIQARLNQGKDRTVIVKADREVALDKAVKVMDMAKAAGAVSLCLATEKG